MLGDSVRVITMSSESIGARLEPDEVDAICHFAFRVHDEEQRETGHPIFWYRLDGKELWKFQN